MATAATTANGRQTSTLPATARTPEAAPRNGDSPASSRQVKFVLGLAQNSHGMKIAQIREFLRSNVGQPDPHRLTRQQASRAIEILKGDAS